MIVIVIILLFNCKESLKRSFSREDNLDKIAKQMPAPYFDNLYKRTDDHSLTSVR